MKTIDAVILEQPPNVANVSVRQNIPNHRFISPYNEIAAENSELTRQIKHTMHKMRKLLAGDMLLSPVASSFIDNDIYIVEISGDAGKFKSGDLLNSKLIQDGSGSKYYLPSLELTYPAGSTLGFAFMDYKSSEKFPQLADEGNYKRYRRELLRSLLEVSGRSFSFSQFLKVTPYADANGGRHGYPILFMMASTHGGLSSIPSNIPKIFLETRSEREIYHDYLRVIRQILPPRIIQW